MEEIYEKLGAADLWQISKSANETAFDVTEAWLDHESGKVSIEQSRVDASSFPTWLEAESRQSSNGSQSLLQRLVWLDVDVKGKRLRLANMMRDKLLDQFGLKLAHMYFKTYVTGITSLPAASDQVGERRAFALSHAPKLAALWCQQRFEISVNRPPVTRSIIFMPEEQKKVTRKALESNWHSSLYYNPMFPAFLLAMQLDLDIDKVQEGIKVHVREVERRTGYHKFQSRDDAIRQGELGPLAADTSGYATKLASVERKGKAVSKILDFMKLQISDYDSPKPKLAVAELAHDPRWSKHITNSCELLLHHIQVLHDRLHMQMVDNEYTLKRVDIQIQALFSLITQNDSLNSLKQAQSTQAIAEASYRDASSMKTLAVVTMFFLPGSFISAMFSMPMFEWDKVDRESSNIGVKLMPQFSLYWSITIPLTMITFLLYFIWLRIQKREFQEKTDASRKDTEAFFKSQTSEVEAQRLEQKRREAVV